MKKTLFVIGLCAVLLSMPTLLAFPTLQKTSLLFPQIKDNDGTFVGGLGRLYRQSGEWQFDYHSYLAGVYKNGVYKKLYGYIYDLNEQQIGYIGGYFGHKIIYGYVEDMQSHRLPMIGFLFWNNENFAGRIMSMIGSGPNIIGQYTPNT
jgi:hypothetical protein